MAAVRGLLQCSAPVCVCCCCRAVVWCLLLEVGQLGDGDAGTSSRG